MATAGSLDILGIKYPRMQLLTIEEVIDGKKFKTPTIAGRGAENFNLPLK